jgi:hypothetical protein
LRNNGWVNKLEVERNREKQSKGIVVVLKGRVNWRKKNTIRDFFRGQSGCKGGYMWKEEEGGPNRNSVSRA